MPRYAIRRATVADAATIARHRVAMYCDMGKVPTEALVATLLQASTAALAAALGDGSYVGWLAADARHRVVAGAGVHIKPQLPRISVDGTRVVVAPLALVVNVYTEPRLRRQGIARLLMAEVMQWSVARGFDGVVLHASDDGRPLYESLGFVPTNEMRWGARAERERGRDGE
jgi:GNAT superfamily N-acetyltransferase